MKKLAFPLIVLALLFASQTLAPHAYANNEPCPGGTDGECPGSEVCDTGSTPFLCVAGDGSAGSATDGNGSTNNACTNDDQCSGNLACISGRCQIDPSLEDAGTAGANGACGQVPGISGTVECGGDQTCSIPSGQTRGTCVGSTGNAAATPTGAPTVAGPTGTAGNGLQSPLKDQDITSLLNDLLGFAITIGGIAVVLMLVWCGFLFIKAQGNPTQLEEARRMLMWTVIGALVLLGAKAIESGVQATVQSLSS